MLLTKDTKTIIQGQAGTFSITVASIIQEQRDLGPQQTDITAYECVLTVPNTTYSAHKSLSLQKGKCASCAASFSSSSSSSFSPSPLPHLAPLLLRP